MTATAISSTKWCPKCKRLLSTDEFNRSKGRRDGLSGWCKTCRSADGKRYYENNKEQILVKHAEWREDNKEYSKEYAARYYQENRAKCDAATRDWYQRNPHVRAQQSLRDYYKHREDRLAGMRRWRSLNLDLAKAISRLWRLRNPEQARHLRRTYKARKKGATGFHSAADIQDIWKAQRGRCAYCRCKLNPRNTHVDHIMPLRRQGSNWRANLQLTCAACNIKKGASDPLDFARRIGRLI